MNVTTLTRSPLTDEMVESCGQRAAEYDRENRFFAEDFEELRRRGYLLVAVPTELGGRGLNLAEMSAKYHAVESAKRVVDLAMDVSGGAGIFKQNELERLYRDVRCGGFHPVNSALTHEIVGETTLGVDLHEQPRWG